MGGRFDNSRYAYSSFGYSIRAISSIASISTRTTSYSKIYQKKDKTEIQIGDTREREREKVNIGSYILHALHNHLDKVQLRYQTLHVLQVLVEPLWILGYQPLLLKKMY